MNDYEGVKLAFLDWCKLPKPKPEGMPQTEEEFADQHGVSRRSLQRYKKSPAFKRELAEFTIGYLSSGDIAEIIGAVKDKAKQGSVPHAKWLFDQSGITAAINQVPEMDSEELAGLSDAEIAALLDEDDE